MTLTQAQTILHALYTGDDQTPASSDAEWTVRAVFLNAGINAWDTEIGMIWNELWTTLADAGDGDKTINASDLLYTAPTDIRFLGGYIETFTNSNQRTKWRVVKPEKAALLDGDSIEVVVGFTEGHVWLTGNKKAGFVINFSSQATAGDTLDYPYYQDPTTLSGVSDVIEMSDPYFAVYFALSKLHENEGAGDQAAFAMGQAEEKLKGMKTLNAMAPPFQLNGAENSTILRTGRGFGK